jgi:hypothetical protein
VNKTVGVYGEETWVIKKSEKIKTLERKILRKIFGSVKDDSQRSITTNAELEKLYKDVKIRAFVGLKCFR